MADRYCREYAAVIQVLILGTGHIFNYFRKS
jgi:hypothetical protein